MTPDPTTETDVLIVGGGPAGTSAAARLAEAGHGVVLVERRAEPRRKPCGDALTPRACAELAALGLDADALHDLGGHHTVGVRIVHGDASTDVPWPVSGELGAGARGMTLRRDLLDEALRRRAHAAGASVLLGHEAVAPILERGFVRGATMQLADGSSQDIRSRFVVIADGADSRFGRGLGTTRERDWPYAVAARTYFASDRADEPWTEARLGPADQAGRPVAGLAWVHPLGDGTVNVGVGLLSTYRDVMSVNALRLLDDVTRSLADDWHLDPDAHLEDPGRFRIPLGGSVGPKAGPTFLVAGDAGGMANPFNGEGVSSALVSGRVAAEVLHDALTTGNSTTLQRYPHDLAEHFGDHHAVGRLTARFVGRPSILDPILRWGVSSPSVMGGVLRIATGELRTDGRGTTERAYRWARRAARFAPSW